jgi:poly-gamma-glutamate synthesis protein (capsule biosynthesis protein)
VAAQRLAARSLANRRTLGSLLILFAVLVAVVAPLPPAGPAATERPGASGPAPSPFAVDHPWPETSWPETLEPTRPQQRTVTVVASGDVLLHSGLWRQAARDAAAVGRGGYDFGPLFAAVRPVVAGADLAICHLETPVGQPAGPFTGYPIFEVPPQVVPALADLGYDACSTASNHSLDRGEAGIRRTLDALDAAGLAHAGTHRSEAEWAAPTILTAAGVRIGHLSYTFSFNGLRRPAGRPWVANDLHANAILAEAGRARAAGAEIVIVSLHWGTEYSNRANAEQIALARHLLAAPEIDLIVGHHAHVVQPFERIGDKWVVYGLGNHVAWQPQRETTRDGVLARMTLTEVAPASGGAPGRWRVTLAEAIPTWMSLSDPARLLLVSAAIGGPGTPPAVREACARSLRRTSAVLTSRGAAEAGLRIAG